MNEIEKVEKAIEGIQAKIQLQKAENQKLRNSLNEIEMNKSNAMKEIQRLKDVNISLENGTIYKSITECGNVLQLSIGNISSVLNKRRKQTKGYTFRYADQVLYKGDVNND